MDREKLLKKWKILTIAEWIFLYCWDFAANCYIILKPEKAYNFVNLFMMFVGLCIVYFLFQKLKPENRKIMPMIISIHDTVEKLTRQRIILMIIGISIKVVSTLLQPAVKNILLLAVQSLWILFICLADLTRKKINYFKEKPEGMNF